MEECASCSVQLLPQRKRKRRKTQNEQMNVDFPKSTRRRTKNYIFTSNFPLLLAIILWLSPFVSCDMLKDAAAAPEKTANSARFACNQVYYVYNALSKSKGFLDADSAPKNAISGNHLTICAKGLTCCTEAMEANLSDQSEVDFQRSVQDQMIALRHTFESRQSKFDRFFRELLSKSRRELHVMFQQTYGPFYMGHRDLFTRLFDNLTDYYSSGKTDVDETFNSFYADLYRRMFQIMNPQYNLQEAYWQCMRRHMIDLKPFGDAPRKMQQQVHRSFVASRAFVQALAVGRDVVHSIMEIKPSNACRTALMRLTYCGHCRGMPSVKPCNNFCLNVAKGCLAHHAELDQDWNNFIDALLELLDRIRGPFNIESLIGSINVKISNAIMNFQENGEKISEHVTSGCGEPPPGRKKRSPNLKDLELSSSNGSNLQKLATDIKDNISPLKGFWRNVPHNLCNNRNFAAPAQEETNCWNGLTKDRYQPALVGDGMINQLNNPEVRLTSEDQQNPVITDQILRLRMATSRLKDAFHGRDVKWHNTDSASQTSPDEIEELSGSGDDSESDFESRTKPSFPQNPPYGQHPDDEDSEPEGSGDFEGSGMPDVIDPRGSHRENDMKLSPEFVPRQPQPVWPRTNTEPERTPIFDGPEERPSPDFEIGIQTESPTIELEPKGPAKDAQTTVTSWVTVFLTLLVTVYLMKL